MQYRSRVSERVWNFLLREVSIIQRVRSTFLRDLVWFPANFSSSLGWTLKVSSSSKRRQTRECSSFEFKFSLTIPDSYSLCRLSRALKRWPGFLQDFTSPCFLLYELWRFQQTALFKVLNEITETELFPIKFDGLTFIKFKFERGTPVGGWKE